MDTDNLDDVEWRRNPSRLALKLACDEQYRLLREAVEALMDAMAEERPLREPETSAAVLVAWDRLEALLWPEFP